MKFFATTFILMCAFTSVTNAQTTYEITPSRTTQVVAPVDGITIFDIYQQNLTQEPINIAWRKVSINLPSEWDYSMCELGRCYGGIPDSSQMDDLAPSEKAFLGLNIIPNGVSGSGTVTLYVFDTRFPEKRDTLTWIVSTASAGVSVSTEPAVTFSVRPNPSVSHLTCNFSSNFSGLVTLSAINGTLLQRHAINGNELSFDLGNLPAGSYMVQAVGKDGHTYSTHVIKK